jgi:phage major head subunit gpT-like protein
MSASLVDMAALTVDHKGSLRTAADREDVVRMAMHTTGDLPSILENALHKRLGAAYMLAEPTYRRIAAEMSFADFRPHPVSNLSDFPMLEQVSEAGEIKYGTLSDKKESVVLVPWAKALTLSRQMIVNDDLGAIDRMVSGYGTTVAAFEDKTFWAMALGWAAGNGPTMTETGRQMFNSTDEFTLAGTPSAITVASLSAGRAALRKRKRLDGTDLAISAAVLLVGPDKETEAQQIVAPIQAQQAGNVNPFSGTLSVVTTAKITGNAWYLFAAPTMLANFTYGYLNGQSGPRFRMEEPFGRQGVSFSVELDFGCGAGDWRGGWKNAGA